MLTCGKPIEVYVTLVSHEPTRYRVNKIISVETHKDDIEIWLTGTNGEKKFLVKNGTPGFFAEKLLEWGWITPAIKGSYEPASIVFWHKNRKYMQRLETEGVRSIILRPDIMEISWKRGQIESIVTLGEDRIQDMKLRNLKTYALLDRTWDVGLKYFTDSGMLKDVTKND